MQRGALLPLFEVNYVSGAAMFARTAMLRSLGGFDQRYVRSQDYHLTIRAALSHQFAVVPGGPTYLYTQHDSVRGSSVERFHPQMTARKWLKFDQKIYFELLMSLPDEFFKSPGVNTQRRNAVTLTNRARVAASKLLGEQVMDALIARVLQFAEILPDDSERSSLAEIPLLGQWYGVGVLAADRRFWKAVKELASMNSTGAAIAGALAVRRQSRVCYGLSVMLKGY